MTNTHDPEADLNAAVDAAILAVLEDGEWMPYLLVCWTLEAVPNLFGVPNRIHALERRGLIESRIWGQGDERQLWLRRTKQESLKRTAEAEPSIPVSRIVAVLAERIDRWTRNSDGASDSRVFWGDLECRAVANELGFTDALDAELARRKGTA